MDIQAFKMDGLGNDFVIIDNRQKIINLTKDQIIKICDRNFVGCDQLIFIESSKSSNANLKFFLDAAPEVRAKRRHLELQKRGQEVNMHDLINDIVERDKKDRTRDLSPLIKTEDSILLDSTNLDQESILTEALQHIKERNIL